MTDKEIISRLEHIIAVQNERIRQLIAETREERQMSDDELLMQQLEYGPHHAELSAKALARIRELEAELEEADRRAKKLEAALVEKLVAWDGNEPTHVIVERELLDECERALDRLSNWFVAHAADAPEWTGKEQVKCYFSIDELRQAEATLAKLRAQEAADE